MLFPYTPHEGKPMTKNYTRAAVSLLALALAFGTAGCTATDTKADESTEVETAATQDVGTAVVTEAPDDDAAADSDQREALTEYVDAAQAAIPQILEATPGVYSSAEINAIDSNILEFAYYYADQLDADATAEGLDGVIPSLQSVADSAVFPEMIREGITENPQIRYTYYNADGGKIWEHTFSPS